MNGMDGLLGFLVGAVPALLVVIFFALILPKMISNKREKKARLAAEQARLARERKERAEAEEKAREKARAEAKRAQEAAEKAQLERFRSSELFQRICNDCVNSMVESIRSAYRGTNAHQVETSKKVEVFYNGVYIGGRYGSGTDYIFNVERYDNLETWERKDFAKCMLKELETRLKAYLNNYSFAKDSQARIEGEWEECGTPGYGKGSYFYLYIRITVKYIANNGYYIKSQSW